MSKSQMKDNSQIKPNDKWLRKSNNVSVTIDAINLRHEVVEYTLNEVDPDFPEFKSHIKPLKQFRLFYKKIQ